MRGFGVLGFWGFGVILSNACRTIITTVALTPMNNELIIGMSP